MFYIILFSLPTLLLLIIKRIREWYINSVAGVPNEVKEEKHIKTIKEKTNDFFLKNLTEFKKIINTPEKNKNIDIVFYNKQILDNIMVEKDNDIEKKWKQKILYVATPLGNVIMYYDAYKMGFSYNSDVFMPYDILNAVALKYVRVFKCIDFFMDEKVMEENEDLREHKSPLINTTEEPEQVSETKKKETMNFYEKKIYEERKKIIEKKKKVMTQEEIEKQKLIEKEKKYTYNRFYNLGKITNFNLLNVSQKKEKAIKKVSYGEYKQYKFTDNPVFDGGETLQNHFTPNKNTLFI